MYQNCRDPGNYCYRIPTNAPTNTLAKLLLAQIAASPKATLDELASIVLEDRSTVRRNMKKLQEAGLVVRVAQIGEDVGRSSQVNSSGLSNSKLAKLYWAKGRQTHYPKEIWPKI